MNDLESFASLQLGAEMGLTAAAGETSPTNPPNHPQSVGGKGGLTPRMVPHDVLATVPTANLTAAGRGVWLVTLETPSQGKLWNLRAAVLVTTDPLFNLNADDANLSIGVFKIASGQRVNGQAGNAEPQADIVSAYCGGAIGQVAPWADFGRYEEWVRPGQYLAAILAVNGTVGGAGTGQATIRFKIDQYDESDILPRWQG